jgi:hypothetical protein
LHRKKLGPVEPNFGEWRNIRKITRPNGSYRTRGPGRFSPCELAARAPHHEGHGLIPAVCGGIKGQKNEPHEDLLRGCRGALSVRHRLQAVTSIGSHDLYRLMADPIQQVLNGDEISAILTAISLDRFNTYLTAAGHNRERALPIFVERAVGRGVPHADSGGRGFASQ